MISLYERIEALPTDISEDIWRRYYRNVFSKEVVSLFSNLTHVLYDIKNKLNGESAIRWSYQCFWCQVALKLVKHTEIDRFIKYQYIYLYKCNKYYCIYSRYKHIENPRQLDKYGLTKGKDDIYRIDWSKQKEIIRYYDKTHTFYCGRSDIRHNQ